MWTGVSGHKTKSFHRQTRILLALAALASEPFDVRSIVSQIQRAKVQVEGRC